MPLQRLGKTINCVYFGRCALSLQVPVKYEMMEYTCVNISSEELEEAVEEVASVLNIDTQANKLQCLSSGVYVYGWQTTIRCSRRGLQLF